MFNRPRGLIATSSAYWWQTFYWFYSIYTGIVTQSHLIKHCTVCCWAVAGLLVLVVTHGAHIQTAACHKFHTKAQSRTVPIIMHCGWMQALHRLAHIILRHQTYLFLFIDIKQSCSHTHSDQFKCFTFRFKHIINSLLFSNNRLSSNSAQRPWQAQSALCLW